MVNRKKSAPIKMKYNVRANNETDAEATIRETTIGQDNSTKDRQYNAGTENNPSNSLSLNNTGNRSSNRQRKAPKSLSKDFLWQLKL